MKPTYGGTLVFSCLCSGSPLCHHYTDTSLIRQDSECLSLYSEFQRAVFNGIEKRSLYWLGHLGAIYQRVSEKILKTPSYTSRRNFQIRTLLNIFFDLFFQGVLCLNLNGWLFISQVVAGENGILSIVVLKWWPPKPNFLCVAQLQFFKMFLQVVADGIGVLGSDLRKNLSQW